MVSPMQAHLVCVCVCDLVSTPAFVCTGEVRREGPWRSCRRVEGYRPSRLNGDLQQQSCVEVMAGMATAQGLCEPGVPAQPSPHLCRLGLRSSIESNKQSTANNVKQGNAKPANAKQSSANQRHAKQSNRKQSMQSNTKQRSAKHIDTRRGNT